MISEDECQTEINRKV